MNVFNQARKLLQDSVDSKVEQWLIYNLQIRGMTLSDAARFELRITSFKKYELYLDGVKVSTLELSYEIHTT